MKDSHTKDRVFATSGGWETLHGKPSWDDCLRVMMTTDEALDLIAVLSQRVKAHVGGDTLEFHLVGRNTDATELDE